MLDLNIEELKKIMEGKITKLGWKTILPKLKKKIAYSTYRLDMCAVESEKDK